MIIPSTFPDRDICRRNWEIRYSTGPQKMGMRAEYGNIWTGSMNCDILNKVMTKREKDPKERIRER